VATRRSKIMSPTPITVMVAGTDTVATTVGVEGGEAVAAVEGETVPVTGPAEGAGAGEGVRALRAKAAPAATTANRATTATGTVHPRAPCRRCLACRA
jgi:hypothetical protein